MKGAGRSLRTHVARIRFDFPFVPKQRLQFGNRGEKVMVKELEIGDAEGRLLTQQPLVEQRTQRKVKLKENNKMKTNHENTFKTKYMQIYADYMQMHADTLKCMQCTLLCNYTFLHRRTQLSMYAIV